MNTFIAVSLFLGIFLGIGYFYTRAGRLSFWKLASKIPDQAFDWFRDDPAWAIVQKGQHPPEPRSDFDGPFTLAIPRLGTTIRIYGRQNEYEASEQKFLEAFKSQVTTYHFPIVSALALLYPLVAMLSTLRAELPVVTVLGYGFSNLGYLLGAAFIFPGHFRVLGLDNRVPTIVFAVIAWIVGVFFSNIA